MTYKCNYNSDLNTIEATTYGIASIAELIDMFRCIAKLCAQKQSANVLVDHSELDASPLTMDEVKILSRITVSSKDILKMRKCAHIANKDLQFGLVRAWEIMVDISGFTNLEARVFKSRDDAIEWIKSSS